MLGFVHENKQKTVCVFSKGCLLPLFSWKGPDFMKHYFIVSGYPDLNPKGSIQISRFILHN